MPRVNTKILTTVILLVFRGLNFESDPRGIGYAFHRAGVDISEKDSFRSSTIYKISIRTSNIKAKLQPLMTWNS
jgi:hypothetical protein